MTTILSVKWCEAASDAFLKWREDNEALRVQFTAAMEVCLKGLSPRATATGFASYLKGAFKPEDPKMFRDDFGFPWLSNRWSELFVVFWCLVFHPMDPSLEHCGFPDVPPWKPHVLAACFEKAPEAGVVCCKLDKATYSPIVFEALWVAQFGNIFSAKCPCCFAEGHPSAFEICHVVAHATLVQCPTKQHLLCDIKNLRLACHACNALAATHSLDDIIAAQAVIRRLAGLQPSEVVVVQHTASERDQLEMIIAKLDLLATSVTSAPSPVSLPVTSSASPPSAPALPYVDSRVLLVASSRIEFLWDPSKWPYPVPYDLQKAIRELIAKHILSKFPDNHIETAMAVNTCSDVLALQIGLASPDMATLEAVLTTLFFFYVKADHGVVVAKRTLSHMAVQSIDSADSFAKRLRTSLLWATRDSTPSSKSATDRQLGPS